MKLTSLFCLAVLFSLISAAQTPQSMNYQAVARTTSGQIIPSQNISVRFSILEGTTTGTVLFQETHNTVTNSFGLFTLGIGKGTITTGTIASIPWENGNKFLKVEIAPQGGSNYTVQGTSQLLSVPYALYSERTKLLAGNNTITITGGNTIMGNYQAANNTVLITGNTIAGNYLAANNTILVTGNTIAGNYVPANNTIAITGNTIGGNYVAGNNTIAIAGNAITGNYVPANNTINITGNAIAGNYVAANNTIAITGNTIASNYQAGAGINIVGNTISAPGNSLWLVDPNGIHNQSGSVGIGTNSTPNSMLTIEQVATGGFSGALDVTSNDTRHTVTRFRNTTVNQEWQFHVGGSSNNNEIHAGAFGISDNNAGKWLITGDAATAYMSVGSADFNSPIPKSRLHVFEGDVNIDRIGSGIIMKSPNGNCWRITIDNAGNLVRTAIACP